MSADIRLPSTTTGLIAGSALAAALALAAIGAGTAPAGGGLAVPDTVINYTVTGKILTPTGGNASANNVPVQFIRVIVMDQEPGPDQELGRGYTNAAGDFSIAVSDNEPADIFVDVEYVGDAIDGRQVEVRRADTDANPIKDTNVEGTVHVDAPGGVLALDSLHVASTRANIVTQGCRAFRYLEGQYSAYTLPANPRYEGRTTNGASYVSNDGSKLSIAMEDYDSPGAGNAAFSDIHHETFHWIAYRAYGNRWPDNNCACNPHHASKECCQGFAMQEGSAQYFGNISAIATFGGDNKTNLPGQHTWRGEDNTGNNNCGEIVEGTFTRALRQNAEHPGQLETLLTKSPDTWAEFRDGYAAIKGATSAAMQNLMNRVAQDAGIVYTRGKIVKFEPEVDPPDAAPPHDGDSEIIRDIAFVRGKTKPKIELNSKAELRLASPNTVNADQKDVGYQAAAAGLGGGRPTALTYVGAVNWADNLEWDTSTVTDGEYDVVARTRSIHHWIDTFYPDFTGDATAAINTNERWLKTLRTWYNQDAAPDNDKEGKVVIDNGAPEVQNFTPEP